MRHRGLPSFRGPALAGAVALAAAAVWACTTEPEIHTLVVWPDSLDLVPYDSLQLSVATLDEDSTLLTGIPVSFSSSDSAVVAVTGTGLVRSFGAVGSAMVTVAAASEVRTVPAVVSALAATVVAAPADTTVPRSATYQLRVTISDASGRALTGVSVAYESVEPAVATVSPTGLVTAEGGGETTIIVRAATASTTARVRVIDPDAPGRIEVEPADTTIGQLASYQLRVRVFSVAGAELSDAVVDYASSDLSIVTASSTGVVTSEGPAGNATITVRSDTARATADVHVTDTSIVARLPLSGSPFAAAISGSGVVYVGRATADSLVRIDMPTIAFSGALAVASGPTGIAFDPAATTAYVTNQFSQNVGVIAVASNTQTGTIAVPGNPFVVKVSPDGQLLWATTNIGKLLGIDLGTTSVVHDFDFAAASNSIAFHPTHDSLLYAGVISGTVVEIDVRRDSVLRTFSVGGVPQGIAVSPAGDELYVANEGTATLQVVSLASGTVIATVSLAGGAFDLQLSPDGASLWLGEPAVGRVQVVDRASRTIIRTILTGGVPRRMAFDPAGPTLIGANEAGWVDFIR